MSRMRRLKTNKMNIRFFKGNTEPTSAEVGSVWFDSTSKQIKVKTGTDWDNFSENQKILTQSEYDALTDKDENTVYFIKEE